MKNVPDITDTTKARFQASIDAFQEGQSIQYKEVVFRKDYSNSNLLHIDTYSNWLSIKNIKREEAEKEIAKSKSVFIELCEASPEFAQTTKKMLLYYNFCQDYGMGSTCLAQEINGQVTWHVQSNDP